MSGAAPSEETVLRAGEYVLGVLDAPELAQVRLESDRDPALATAIGEWEDRLFPLARLVPAVSPPAALWSRIAASIAATDAPEVSTAPSESRVIRRSLAFWRGTTAAGFALAAAIAAFAILRPPPGGTLPVASAVLLGKNDAPAYLLEADAAGRAHLRPISPVKIAANQDLELWALPAGKTVPEPLGVFPTAGGTLALPPEPKAGMQVMVSLEAQGGSVTGKPGPVLFAGQFAKTDQTGAL